LPNHCPSSFPFGANQGNYVRFTTTHINNGMREEAKGWKKGVGISAKA
jgi:hypothetical protein